MSRNITRGTLTRLAEGRGVSLDSFVRVMRALGLAHHLAALLPDPSMRPVERLRFEGKERKRASHQRKSVERSGWRWFPSLSRVTFKGLPGMLADSLPDKFGSALVDAWLTARGRPPGSFTPVERLCYTGSRGMGALEFEPAVLGPPSEARKIEIDQLVALANRVLDDRIALEGKLSGEDDRKAIEDLLRVGTSAGGARAKAVLAYNPETGKFRSGQAPAGQGFSHYLIKFDGVSGNRDKELADPLGFGRIEYAYHLMALEAGIEMQECRLHEEGGRAHFMTRRFDRTDNGDKLHAQSLGALMHYDFNLAGAYAYEHEDIESFAVTSGLKKAKTRSLFAEVAVALEKWPRLAKQAGVSARQAEAILRSFRAEMPGA